MGDAYTPGLTVTRATIVRKTRRLPLPGTVLVETGARVTASDVIARTELPGRVHLANLANQLSVMPDELTPTLKIPIGGKVSKGTVVATSKSFFGLLRNQAESPIAGTLEAVSDVTGMAVFREPPVPVEVTAYVDGEVVEILPSEG